MKHLDSNLTKPTYFIISQKLYNCIILKEALFIMNYFAKRIIPCLDVKDGRVVKGVNFVGLRDAGDPVEVAKRYNEEGADEITFLDIMASSDNKDTIVDIVAQVAKEVFIPLTVGGGIRKVDDIYKLLNVGCDKVSVNSAAIKRPELINEALKDLVLSAL